MVFYSDEIVIGDFNFQSKPTQQILPNEKTFLLDLYKLYFISAISVTIESLVHGFHWFLCLSHIRLNYLHFAIFLAPYFILHHLWWSVLTFYQIGVIPNIELKNVMLYSSAVHLQVLFGSASIQSNLLVTSQGKCLKLLKLFSIFSRLNLKLPTLSHKIRILYLHLQLFNSLCYKERGRIIFVPTVDLAHKLSKYF